MIQLPLRVKIMTNNKTNPMFFNIFVPFLALLSFITWFTNLNELITMGIFITILITLLIIKADLSYFIMLACFSLLAQREPYFLKVFDNLYFKVFNTKITALSDYYIFLYLLMAFLVGVIALIRFIKNKTFENTEIIKLMTIITIYSLITLIWAPNLVDGLSEFSFFIQGYLVYLFIKNSDSKITFKQISWLLSLFLLVLSLEYLVVYIKYPGLNKSPLYHLWANPNIVASIFGVTFIASLYKYINFKKNKLILLYLIVDAFIIWAIVKSQSAGLHYAFLAAFLFIPFLLIKSPNKQYILIVSGILAYIIFLALVVLLEQKYPNIYNMFNEFSTNRFDIYKTALNEVRKLKWLIFGHGLGYDRVVLSVDFFHSWFFQILVNRGFIGLILMFMLLRRVVDVIHSTDDPFKYFLILTTITYLAHGITDSGYEYQFMGVIFYFMIAHVEKINGASKKIEELIV